MHICLLIPNLSWGQASATLKIKNIIRGLMIVNYLDKHTSLASPLSHQGCHDLDKLGLSLLGSKYMFKISFLGGNCLKRRLSGNE